MRNEYVNTWNDYNNIIIIDGVKTSNNLCGACFPLDFRIF